MALSGELTIGKFAEAAGVSVETIRYYQRKGLVREPVKPYCGIRRYGEADLARLRFIKTAQRLGFSLDEIVELLRLDEGTHCEDISRLAERRLEEVRERLADLQRAEHMLSNLVTECRRNTTRIGCPLIASLHGDMPG